MPATREIEGARAWMDHHAGGRIEGVVAKDRRRGYRPSRTRWIKVRAYRTTEAVVGGVVGRLDAPETLMLGRLDEQGRFRVVGGPLR